MSTQRNTTTNASANGRTSKSPQSPSSYHFTAEVALVSLLLILDHFSILLTKFAASKRKFKKNDAPRKSLKFP